MTKVAPSKGEEVRAAESVPSAATSLATASGPAVPETDDAPATPATPATAEDGGEDGDGGGGIRYGWTCGVCTQFNKNEALKCTVCGRPRGKDLRRASTVVQLRFKAWDEAAGRAPATLVVKGCSGVWADIVNGDYDLQPAARHGGKPSVWKRRTPDADGADRWVYLDSEKAWRAGGVAGAMATLEPGGGWARSGTRLATDGILPHEFMGTWRVGGETQPSVTVVGFDKAGKKIKVTPAAAAELMAAAAAENAAAAAAEAEAAEAAEAEAADEEVHAYDEAGDAVGAPDPFDATRAEHTRQLELRRTVAAGGNNAAEVARLDAELAAWHEMDRDAAQAKLDRLAVEAKAAEAEAALRRQADEEARYARTPAGKWDAAYTRSPKVLDVVGATGDFSLNVNGAYHLVNDLERDSKHRGWPPVYRMQNKEAAFGVERYIYLGGDRVWCVGGETWEKDERESGGGEAHSKGSVEAGRLPHEFHGSWKVCVGVGEWEVQKMSVKARGK